MRTPGGLLWVVEPGADTPAVHYTTRLLSSLVGRTAVVADLSQPPSDSDMPTVWYADVPPRSPSTSLWVSPDQDFWRNTRSGTDISPRAVVAWAGSPYPVWRSAVAARGSVDGYEGGRCNVDPIAAAFFIVSRIEEWRCRRTDRHGRFPAEDAWMVREGVIERPLVHEYAASIARALNLSGGTEGASTPWPNGHRFAIAYTHDVDRLRMHGALSQDIRRAVGALRFPGGIRSAAARLRSRWQVRAGRSRDPYDTFDRLVDLHDDQGFRATFFWINSRPSARDADYDVSQLRVRELLRSLQDRGFEIGLHGSYNSFDSSDLLRREREGLMSGSSGPVVAARQHYLRLHLPDTWRAQIEAGLSVDTTLGFASRFGFRAGLAVPFRPWDFDRNGPFDIWEVPLVMMDGTAREYMRLKPPDAIPLSQRIIARIAEVGGAAAVLWHNSSFDDVDWPGWDAVYRSWLVQTKSLAGWGTTVSDVVTAWKDYTVRLGNA